MSFIVPMKFNIYLAGIISLLFLTWMEAECKGGAAEMNALHKQLLDGYNPIVRPSSNYSNPTVVTLQLFVTDVMGLDGQKQLIFLRAFLKASWIDELLQWNSTSFGDIDCILLPQKSVWTPDLILESTADEHYRLGSDDMFVSINSKGLVSWGPPFYLKGSCKLDMSKYPYDVNVCPVSFQPWKSNNSSITIIVPNEPVSLKYMVINGEYEISSGGVLKYVQEFNHMGFDVVHFQIRLTRRYFHVWLSLMLPVNLLAVLCIVPFILPPEESGKMHLSMTILLAFAVILDVVEKQVPDTSDNLCILVVYIALLLTLSLLSVVGNVLVVTIKSWDETADKEAAKSNTKSHSFCNNVQRDGTEENTTKIYGPTSHDLTEIDNVSTSRSDLIKTMIKSRQKCQNFFQGTRAARVNKAFTILACILLISTEIAVKILYSL